MFELEQQSIENQIRAYCAAQGISVADLQWKPTLSASGWGIATSFFQLAANEARSGKKVNVPQHAQEIAAGVADMLSSLPDMRAAFVRIEAEKGYLNLYFLPSEYARRVTQAALEQGKDFGRGESKGERVMVEFSNPNTHKAFHVGHLRSAILGDSISRILDFAGYEVVPVNYIGDMGLHVIKWLWNYMNYHAGEQPPEDTTRWMGELYAESVKRLDANPDLESQVRELYSRWDRRDPEVVALWQKTRQWSIDHFNKMYALLDIHFERWYSNSEAEQPGKEVVAELIAKGIAEDERPQGGPVIVKIDQLLGLKAEKYRVLVVLRSDNTALYATEDLALAKMKFGEYNLDRSIYVVDVRQSLHFQQVFKTLELAGYAWAAHCEHLPYEIVNLPGNVVMASREGTVVLLEGLIREAIQRARQKVEELNPDLTEQQKDDVAQAVGLGALKYPMLARDNVKIFTFDWESALNYTGQAAIYIQYAQVRANSILRKQSSSEPASQDLDLPIFAYPLDPTEIRLVDLISRLPGEIQRSAAELKTLTITNLAYELARAFTEFYTACPVLKAEPAVRASRLRLVAAARQAIVNLLALLGIIAPEVM